MWPIPTLNYKDMFPPGGNITDGDFVVGHNNDDDECDDDEKWMVIIWEAGLCLPNH